MTKHSRPRPNKNHEHSESHALSSTRKTLPIFQHKTQILNHIASNKVTVIIGETGSGKSTQIPQFLMESSPKQVAVTQPRRVAAASLAQRVSAEYGCALGQQVGYQVRFANVTSDSTKLKYVTDGMLLREITIDPQIKKYSTIVIDEAHERTVVTDLLLGFLKQLITSGLRPDLAVVIMSATLNAEVFGDFFGALILYVEGRMFSVSKYYLNETSDDIVDTLVRAVVQINSGEPLGDVLCFLPGQEEIDNAVAVLTAVSHDLPPEMPRLVPVPVYAALSPAQQQAIFAPVRGHARKIVVATNIAETSITVSGVRYVVDSGLRKVKVWKPQLGLSTLLTTPISQASAKQRAGRAGREAPGKVFRLYLESAYKKLPFHQEPEIMRSDILLPILTLKKLGVDDLLNWSWLQHPGQEAIVNALTGLYSMKALDDNGKITSFGLKMALLPLPPQLSVVLLTATETGVLAPVIDIVACLSVDNWILNVPSGDGELRDEVNIKRRHYCPLGCKYGDLIAMKEYWDYYCQESDEDAVNEWCHQMYLSRRGFKNIARVRTQLVQYMEAAIKQDTQVKPSQKQTQLTNLRSQLHQIEDEVLRPPMDIAAVIKSFLRGFSSNTAIGMPDRSYRTCSTGQTISIHPSSNLFGQMNDAVMYIEYVFTTKGYARTCSRVEMEWLQQ